MLDLGEYDFDLPQEQIAKFPVSPRDSSRLLVTHPRNGSLEHRLFRDLPSYLQPGDVLVLNTTKVLKARLRALNESGRSFEVLLLSPLEGMHRWRCLVRPGRQIADIGSDLKFEGGETGLVIRSQTDSRQFEISFKTQDSEAWLAWLDRTGEVPLPPYLKREAVQSDSATYQTVYAETPSSVAAPTAGLHFTPELLKTLKDKGVIFENICLDIGYGTFSPVEPSAETLHSETYRIAPEVAKRLRLARQEGRRVIAVGTTSLRALESAAGGALQGETCLFIKPGYRFSQVDGLITNFHLPQSSLFILVCAFMGTPNAQSAYRQAIEARYRFFSYGDAMAIL